MKYVCVYAVYNIIVQYVQFNTTANMSKLIEWR